VVEDVEGLDEAHQEAINPTKDNIRIDFAPIIDATSLDTLLRYTVKDFVMKKMPSQRRLQRSNLMKEQVNRQRQTTLKKMTPRTYQQHVSFLAVPRIGSRIQEPLDT
jgi:hypothetical protein